MKKYTQKSLLLKSDKTKLKKYRQAIHKTKLQILSMGFNQKPTRK